MLSIFFGDMDIGIADKLSTTRNKVSHKINPKMVSTRRRHREEPLSPNTKKARQRIVHKYADQQVVELQQQSRVVGYGKVKKMMDEARKVHPWLTELQVKSRAKRLKKSINRVLVDVTNNTRGHATTTVTRQGGRPKGSTDVAKKVLGTKKIKATEEVAKKMNAVKHSLGKGL
jgi:hypothetical protein